MKTVRIFKYRSDGSYDFEDYRCSAAVEEGKRDRGAGTARRAAGSLRIMTLRDIAVRPGDYAAFTADRTLPDKNGDYMITAVRDNRRGGLPHWRLIVNGGI